MEKLLFYLSVLLLVSIQSLKAQESSYCVFETDDGSFFNNNQKISKGDFINEGDIIITNKESNLILVNKEGTLFKIPKSEKTSFNSIAKFSLESESDTFSKKFLQYVWEKFNKKKNNNHIGVVFRLNEMELKQPSDSTLIFSPEITFEWQSPDASEKTYLFLNEVGKSHYFKIGLRDNSVTLFIDNFILKPGKKYQWTISPELFPDLNSLKKYQFKILTENDYQIFMQKHEKFIKNMMSVGIDERDIKLFLLDNYKYMSISE